jgi:hypothetical protein
MASTKSSKTETPAQEQPKATTISLAEIATKYLEALQRQLDLSTFHFSASRLLNEQQYDDFSRNSRVMLLPNARLPFDRAKEETDKWFLKHTLTECLGLVVLFLEDARTISCLCSWKANPNRKPADLQDSVIKDREKFLALDFTGKLKYLQDTHSISSPFADHLISLLRLRECLANRGGTVGEQDTTEAGKLTLKLRGLQFTPNATPGKDENSASQVQMTPQLNDIMRTFNVGQKIELSKQESIFCILTIGFVLTSMLQSLQEQAKKLGVAD